VDDRRLYRNGAGRRVFPAQQGAVGVAHVVRRAITVVARAESATARSTKSWRR